jgi:hypothetical protein
MKKFYWGPKTQAHPKGNRFYSLISKLEFKIFIFFLKRFSEKDLDQWERWELKTKYGEIYVTISRGDDGYEYVKIN